MLEHYKYISIIYGSSGRSCANYLADCIEKMHQAEGYPVKTHLLADEILNSGTILDTIKELILSSAACIVILTFDDVDKSRVRQNVLIEIGMAASCIERDKCFYISEKVPLPEDFPSDLRSSINPNYFDKNDLEAVFNKLKPVICRQLELESNLGLLHEENYEFDYKKILSDIPKEVLNESADEQLDHILQIWSQNISNYDFVSERIMYLAERISFFPTFKSNDTFFSCLKKMSATIKPSKADFDCYDKEYIRAVCKLFNSIIKYSVEKMKPEALTEIENLSEHQIEKLRLTFKHISDDINSFLQNLERSSEWRSNRIVEILAYDYAALALMKSTNYSKKVSLSELEYIEKCFKRVIELAGEDDRSDELWNGYAYYNLARLYERLYRFSKDINYLMMLREAINEAMFFRHEWLEVDFGGAFKMALTFEYFLASKYDYETRFEIRMKERNDEEITSIVSGLERLRKELSEYCESIDVGRLFEIRDSIDVLIERISSKV